MTNVIECELCLLFLRHSVLSPSTVKIVYNRLWEMS